MEEMGETWFPGAGGQGMYTTEYLGTPEKREDLEAIFDLLCTCDRDFVPPLSQRVSSFQKKFEVPLGQDKPYAYFEVMKAQRFAVARDASGRMVAFLTFRPRYSCPELARFGESNYMTTACVDPEHRGHGLVSRLYDIVEHGLPEDQQTDYVTTRTWSTNAVQVHAFSKRGYETAAVLKDDRGPGVDTIYYAKKVR